MSLQEFRPSKWKEFLGQTQIVANLQVYVAAASKQQTVIDHILLHGPSGMGKTSLAYLLAKVLKVKMHYLNGPSLQKPSDVISVLSGIKENQILFIDEVQAVSKEVLEVLYPVLEDNKISLIIGKDYNSKLINLKLPPFTLIGATTELNKLPFPFINRFPINFELQRYSNEELSQIVLKTAEKFALSLDNQTAVVIAQHARDTPRIAINLVKRIFDFSISSDTTIIDEKYVLSTFQQMGIFKYGLTTKDLEYLELLWENNVLGLENLSQLLSTSTVHILTFIEPLLLKQKLIFRTAKGRKITEIGKEYLFNIKKYH